MNKTAIKNYATWARRELIRQVSQKAYEYGISENNIAEVNSGVLGDKVLTKQEQSQRSELVRQIKNKGYIQVMEEVAYTWFNRFIALRFMEVNGYLPRQVRVFTNDENAFSPQIIKDALEVDIDGINRETVISLIEKQQTEDLFKYLIITQCNALGACLPRMFETIENYTELLFPDNLLKEDSVVGRLVKDIDEDDWKDQVQIIGWLYQYYNAEYKDETFALLKKNVKITKERIPSATQLFTPDWIVRYMVENSLGRIWIEGHPNDALKENWKYYLDEAEQEADVEAELAKIREEHSHLNPEDIKVIDPCMGSGHILVYAFDVLVQIYESAGWTARDAALSIVENNLYGIDIDDRAAQLAYFAVMMKARSYDRRFLTRNAKDNLISIQESNDIEPIPARLGQLTLDDVVRNDINYVVEAFKDAKEYGSILKIENRDYDRVEEYIAELAERGADDLIMQSYINTLIEDVPQLIKQAKILSQKYEVVVTNPPYMGASGMSGKLSDYVKKNYPDSKSDLFAIFIEQCMHMTARNAYRAMITQHGWMFLGGYEALRRKILDQNNIVCMSHLGARAFDEIGGEVVQTSSFVTRNSNENKYKGLFIKLIMGSSEYEKEELFLKKENRYTASGENFRLLPAANIAYWLSESMFRLFDKYNITSCAKACKGLDTGDNNVFLRLWHEIVISDIQMEGEYGKKWVPYNKGCGYRRWYGLNYYIINWENDGYELKYQSKANIRNEKFYFKEGITWSDLSTGLFGARYSESKYIFDASGPMMFTMGRSLPTILGYINSIVFQEVLNIICPGLHYNNGAIAGAPIKKEMFDYSAEVDPLVSESVTISKNDWDAFETSWDFKKHPLI